MSTLISFLGKGKNPTAPDYTLSRYRLDSDTCEEVRFIGMALAKHLRPTRLVLLGTAGSMWDVFFEREAEGQVLDDADHWQALSDAVRANAVTQDMLQVYAAHLSQRLGMEVLCRLITAARDEIEQIGLLLDMAQVVPRGETLDIDVTHSFRHLPMLALVAARYLTRTQGVKVRDIYYGAFDMKDNREAEVPVLRLGGLLHMLDGVEALASYDKDGDYSVFAPMLLRDGLPASRVDRLKTAAFFERLQHPEEARVHLQSAVPALEQHQGPLTQLFKKRLLERLSWFRAPSRQERELQLADEHLARRDYLRAAIFMQESCVTRETAAAGRDVTNFRERDEVRKSVATPGSYMQELSNLRNGMAHGVVPTNVDTLNALGSEPSLRKRLDVLRQQLFRTR